MKKLDVPQSGSQADTVASRNRFGQYNRTRATPVNPNTARQILVRSRLANASQAWRGLSDVQRLAWNSWASTVGVVDSLGQTIFPSGHQRFVGLWGILLDAGLAVPPSIPSVAPEPAPTFFFDEASITNGVLATMAGTASVTDVLVFYGSPQLSSGVTFNRDTRYLGKYTAVGVGGLVEVTDNYISKYGPLVVGRRIFLEAYKVTADGGSSQAAAGTQVVVA